MPCTGLSLTSPSISCLDFNLAWDISGATAKVTITNNSTVSSAANLRWWFYVTSPSATAIYGVDLDALSSYPTPDVSGVAWTTKVITLPTPFGNPPCGQIEFSPNSPYTVEVFVEDMASSPAALYSYSKTTIITRPRGNKQSTCGNFGAAQVSMKVDCGTKVIMCFDSTNLIYNNILTPLSTSNLWTLVYPQDPSGDIPNRTATSVPNVNFPISVNSKGYILNFQEYATYDYGNGVTVKVQYKLYDGEGNPGLVFAVNCNTNLCLLQCQMQKYYNLSKKSCGALEDAALTNKIVRLNWLFSQILTGIFQPLCGIDVPALIEEMKVLGGWDDNCDCNCGGDLSNFGFSNPTGAGSVGTCCPVFVGVIDIDTGNPPANCPNGYYPASVYNPAADVVIGIAYSAADVVNIINTNASWQAYGTAFVAGNCQVGFYPLNPGTNPPSVVVSPNGAGTGGGGYIVDVVDPNGDPVDCLVSYFPVQVYNPSATFVIGIAYDMIGLVSIMNADSAWQSYGTAYVVDNCHVGIIPRPGGPGDPPVVTVDPPPANPECVGSRQIYPVTTTDICNNTAPITTSNFPLNVYVDFGSGNEFVANVANQTQMIAALNAHSTKPATVTFIAGPTVDQVIVENAPCVDFFYAINITANGASGSILLYGPNHVYTGGIGAELNPEAAMSMQLLSVLGGISSGGSPGNFWHSIKIGNILMSTSPSDGKIYFHDITNPLMPTLARVIQLNSVVGNNFTGVPQSATYWTATTSPSTEIESLFDLYFPTDYYAEMSLSYIYVVESLTGTIWKISYNAPGTGVLASFQDDKLIGKCPRVLLNGLLYFTQDGNLEGASGQNSGVSSGQIVILDTADFTSTGLDVVSLLDGPAIWAASYDGVNQIYFTNQKTDIITYNTVSSSVTNVALDVLSGMQYRANSTYFANRLYITPQKIGNNLVGGIVDTTTLATTKSYTQFQQPTSGDVDGMFTFTILGNCIGVLTTATIPSAGVYHRVAFYLLDGSYLSEIPLGDASEFYNVVPITGVASTTPNNFV